MILILAIILCILFIFLIIFAFYKVLFYKPLDIGEDCFGRNHCGIVTCSSSFGDIHFDEMTDKEIYERLKHDYYWLRVLKFPCMNAKDESHIAEYRILTENYKPKTIGYITKDKVIFEGKEYIFDKEKENDL